MEQAAAAAAANGASPAQNSDSDEEDTDSTSDSTGTTNPSVPAVQVAAAPASPLSSATRDRLVNQTQQQQPPPQQQSSAPATTGGAPPTLPPRVQTTPHEALYDFVPPENSTPKKLAFRAGEILNVIQKDNSGWWLAELNGAKGWVPAAYLQT
jgi:myosin-1